MNTKTIVKGAFLAFCLIGMLVLPAAAAAPVRQGTNANAAAIDPKLKDDLWNNHVTYRLQAFDIHVNHAKDAIDILEKYHCETDQVKSTLSTITGMRSGLESALNSHEKEKLKAINEELLELWKQFRKEVRDSIRDHYGASGAVRTTGTAGVP